MRKFAVDVQMRNFSQLILEVIVVINAGLVRLYKADAVCLEDRIYRNSVPCETSVLLEFCRREWCAVS